MNAMVWCMCVCMLLNNRLPIKGECVRVWADEEGYSETDKGMGSFPTLGNV